MKSKKILWIGPYLTNEELEIAVEKGYKQVAATLAQQYLVEGLEKNLKQDIEIISAIRPPAYPQYKDLMVKKKTFSHNGSSSNISVGFFNIKYFSHLFRTHELKVQAKKWANTNKHGEIIIFVYSLHSPFLNAALTIKRIIPTSKIVVIIPDLPLNMDMSSALQRLLKRVDWNKIKKLIQNVDKFILYTKHMAEYLNLKHNQWLVIEGLIDERKFNDTSLLSKYKKIICVYMGTLKKEYRITQFAEAFIKANVTDAELHIYGNGEEKENLIKMSEEHPEVQYCGFVSSLEAFNIMKRATLLINPRPSTDEYTKYSCPSKTFEYMASGTPLLSTKLPGIPDEYFDFIYTFENESLEGMTDSITRLLSKSTQELSGKGLAAKEFLMNEKNNLVQCNKIIEFIFKAD